MGIDVRQLEVAPAAPGWPDLVRSLAGQLDGVADRVVARMAELPTCAALPPSVLRPDVREALGLLSAHLPGAAPSSTPPPDAAETAASYRRMGARRAAHGVSPADLLIGWRIIGEELLDAARRGGVRTGNGQRNGNGQPNGNGQRNGNGQPNGNGQRNGNGAGGPGPEETASLLLHLAERLLALRDGAMVASAEGHRAVETDRARRERHARAALVRTVLTGATGAPATPGAPGTGPGEEPARLTGQFGLDRSGLWFAVRARPAPPASLARIESHLLSAEPAAGHGLVALMDGDLCGFVRVLPDGTAPVPVGAGGPVVFSGLPAAFRQATRALEAALALGRSGVLDVAALGVAAAVVADDDVGEALVGRYVLPLTTQGAPGELILDTVSRYVSNDARLDTTARELHVHVNTVRYRLGRFEQVTGCSLRSHDDLVEVWWALRRRALRKPV